MATIKLMQGDSYPILVELTQDGTTLTPELVEDVEIHMGDVLRRRYSRGDLGYDADRGAWWLAPTQEETLAAEPGACPVEAKVKYFDGYVQSVSLGQVKILDAVCGEEI